MVFVRERPQNGGKWPQNTMGGSPNGRELTQKGGVGSQNGGKWPQNTREGVPRLVGNGPKVYGGREDPKMVGKCPKNMKGGILKWWWQTPRRKGRRNTPKYSRGKSQNSRKLPQNIPGNPKRAGKCPKTPRWGSQNGRKKDPKILGGSQNTREGSQNGGKRPKIHGGESQNSGKLS